MSHDSSKYLKIAAIVDQWIIDNDLGSGWFQKGLSWALWGLRELQLDTWQDVKTCLLDVTDRRTVVLPPDYVDWVKIGMKYGQYCITMGVNSNLNELGRQGDAPDAVRGFLSQNLPNGLDFNAYGGYYFFNYYGSSVPGWGLGLRSKNHFKVVKNANCYEILLDYDVSASQIYVEYITSGFDPCGETVLHPYYADYVLKYIELKYEEKNNPNRNESSIFRKGQDVYFAEKKVRARKNDLDPTTLLMVTRAQTRLTPKM